jgi:hypothetical protein
MRHDLRYLGKSLGVANRSAAKFENEHDLLQEVWSFSSSVVSDNTGYGDC